MRLKTNDNIAKTLAVGQLAETKTQELVPATELSNTMITHVAFNASTKLIWVHQAH